MYQRGQAFIPDDILGATRYLEEHGMTEQALTEIHHFKHQSYRQTYVHFTGRSRIQGKKNPLYAARLDYIMRGHASGGNFAALVPQAIEKFPHAD